MGTATHPALIIPKKVVIRVLLRASINEMTLPFVIPLLINALAIILASSLICLKV